MHLLTGLGAAGTLALAAPQVTAGRLAGPAAGALVLLPLALGPVLDELVLAASRVARLLPVARRIAPLVVVPPAPEGLLPLPLVDAVSIDALSARYPGAGGPVFSDLSAAVARGGRLAVTGPSGSGKSTLLAVLLRYLPAGAGGVALDGAPLDRLDPVQVRRRIAWAPQEAHVFDSTLRGNLLLAGDADDAGLRSALDAVGLGPFVAGAPLGLDTPVGPGGSFLSGGQRQRLAVARALLARADVVLLDEPTAHLDRQSADALLADVGVALAGRIQVLVTHDAAAVRPDDARIDLGGTRSAAARSGVGAPN